MKGSPQGIRTDNSLEKPMKIQVVGCSRERLTRTMNTDARIASLEFQARTMRISLVFLLCAATVGACRNATNDVAEPDSASDVVEANSFLSKRRARYGSRFP